MSGTDNLYSSGPGRFATSRRGGIDEYERALIAEKAAKGVPLSAIAKMIARPVEDVKLVIGRPAEREEFVPPKPPRTKGPGIRKMPPAVRYLIEGVAERNGVTVEMLLSDRRFRAVAHPRQECFAVLYATGRYSYPLIGSWFGVDHSTVLFGVRAFKKRLENPPPADPANEAMREHWRWQKRRAAEAA